MNEEMRWRELLLYHWQRFYTNQAAITEDEITDVARRCLSPKQATEFIATQRMDKRCTPKQ